MWFSEHSLDGQTLSLSSNIRICFNDANYNTQVQKGLNEFLFKLFFLRYLMDSDGRMWCCSHKHLYIIELLESTHYQARYAPRTVSWDLLFVHCSYYEIIPHNSIVFIVLLILLFHRCPTKCFNNTDSQITKVRLCATQCRYIGSHPVRILAFCFSWTWMIGYIWYILGN